MGDFRDRPNHPGVKKAASIHGHAELGYLTPSALGRKELFEMVPMQAVFGLQKKERSLSIAFASYAADLDMLGHEEEYKDLSTEEKNKRRSRASLAVMNDFELDRSVVTTPLIFAVMVASMVQVRIIDIVCLESNARNIDIKRDALCLVSCRLQHWSYECSRKCSLSRSFQGVMVLGSISFCNWRSLWFKSCRFACRYSW